MSAQPWFKFFPADWRSDSALRMCSPTGRCLWIEMLCLMSESDPVGYLTVKGRPLSDRALAVQAGLTLEEVAAGLADLEENGVFSRLPDGTIFSRKMVRDGRKSDEQRDRAKKRWGFEKVDENETGNAGGGANGTPETDAHILEARSQMLTLVPSEDKSSSGGASEKRPSKAVRGTRISEDWSPGDVGFEYAKSRGFDRQATEIMAERFRNYWMAKAGSGATKVDWPATWRTWVLNQAERNPPKPKQVDWC